MAGSYVHLLVFDKVIFWSQLIPKFLSAASDWPCTFFALLFSFYVYIYIYIPNSGFGESDFKESGFGESGSGCGSGIVKIYI